MIFLSCSSCIQCTEFSLIQFPLFFPNHKSFFLTSDSSITLYFFRSSKKVLHKYNAFLCFLLQTAILQGKDMARKASKCFSTEKKLLHRNHLWRIMSDTITDQCLHDFNYLFLIISMTTAQRKQGKCATITDILFKSKEILLKAVLNNGRREDIILRLPINSTTIAISSKKRRFILNVRLFIFCLRTTQAM